MSQPPSPSATTASDTTASAVFVVSVVAFMACFSTIPVLDRLALARVGQHALTWLVLALASLLMTTYVLIFTDSPATAAYDASRSPYALGSGALTALLYVAYFRVLADRGMLFIVTLQPLLLATQTVLAVVVLRESVDAWNIAGICVIVVGTVVYNGAYLKTFL